MFGLKIKLLLDLPYKITKYTDKVHRNNFRMAKR